jgi:NACHT domain
VGFSVLVRSAYGRGMGRRRRRWAPDKRGLVQAVVGLIAAVINTALPIGAVFDVIMALGNFKDSDLDIWHARLIEGIDRWAAAHLELLEPVGGLRTGWDQRFLADLNEMGASALLGSDRRTREVVEETLAKSAFLPLVATDASWEAARTAAGRLADDLPNVLVEAAGPQSGITALLQILRSDLGEILARLPPLPADRAICESYLNVVVDELDHDPWTRRAGGRESSLTSIAERLRVTARPDTGYRARGAQAETGDARELAARCERIVLLGGPGAGKSWLARQIVIDAAEQADEELAAQGDPAAVEIPLFASCAAVFDTRLPAWEAVVAAALTQVSHRFGSDRLAEALRRRFLEQGGRFLVVLDGLDEADHLPYGDILDRLAATADRQLRIVLTSRPDSWRRQLPLNEQNDRHRIADVQSMAYPEDVVAVVNAWLDGQPEARDGLIARLEDSAELAQAAETPLLCAMYCLLAESDDVSPVTGAELTARVVTRLLEGTWRVKGTLQGQHLIPQRQAGARTALRQLAWAGAAADPATGLSVWPEMIRHTFDPPLPDEVESAVSNVAPTAPYDPDHSDLARRFLHPSIREHLVAEYVAALPTVAQAQDVIEPHLWYDPQWRHVMPWALAAHPERDKLLDAIIGAEAGVADLQLALDHRDGLGELRRLLVDLAAETSPEGWSDAHAALIDTVCRSVRTVSNGYEAGWLPIAARGWPACRPEARDLADLGAGVVPWPRSEIRAWAGYLELTAAERRQAVQDLSDLLCGPGHVYVDNETAVATILDALHPPPGMRAAAIQGISERLESRADEDRAQALRMLSNQPASDSLLLAIVDQLPTEPSGPNDRWVSDWDVNGKAVALDLLGAGEAVRRQALARVLDYLAAIPAGETTLDIVIEAVVRLRPAIRERARALKLLLTRLPGQDSWHVSQLMGDIGALLPPPAETGAVLLELVRSGPWRRTQEAGQVLGWLAAGASEQGRSAAVAAVHHHMATCGPGLEICEWTRHLNALIPTAVEREAAVGLLISQLAHLPAESCGYPMLAASELRPTSGQREELIGYLLRHVGHTDHIGLKIQLCQMAIWFHPIGAARSAIAVALLEAARSAPMSFHNELVFRDAPAALPFTDEECRTLIDTLISRMPSKDDHLMIQLTELIIETGPTTEQRTSAAQILLTRLNRVATDEDLVRLIEVLQRLDAQMDWRPPVKDMAVSTLTAAASPKRSMYYRNWARLLPDLNLSDDNRRRLANTFIEHVSPLDPNLDAILALLDELRPDPDQKIAIVDRLINIMTEGTAFTAAKAARILLRRSLTTEQQSTIVQTLVAQVTKARPKDLARFLSTATAYPLTREQRTMVATGAVRNLKATSSKVRFFEVNIPETLAALLKIGAMNDKIRKTALMLALDEFARSGSVDPSLSELLPQLGFDIDALKGFAHRYRKKRDVEHLLRELASVLRHNCDPASWKISLGQLAECYPPV